MTDSFADRVERYFIRTHREVFLGDPVVNDRLQVEVVGVRTTEAGRTALVLITPWMINGMFTLAPDQLPPEQLTIGAKVHTVFANALPEIGHYGSVNLVSDTTGLESMLAARQAATALTDPFHHGLASAFDSAAVDDPGRRNLLRGRLPDAAG